MKSDSLKKYYVQRRLLAELRAGSQRTFKSTGNFTVINLVWLQMGIKIKMETENLICLKSHWVSGQRGTLSGRFPSSSSSLWRCSAPPLHRSQASQMRKEKKIIVKNMTLWKRSGDNLVVTVVFFNSIRYKVTFVFPAVIHYTLAPQMNGVGASPARVSFIIWVWVIR